MESLCELHILILCPFFIVFCLFFLRNSLNILDINLYLLLTSATFLLAEFNSLSYKVEIVMVPIAPFFPLKIK